MAPRTRAVGLVPNSNGEKAQSKNTLADTRAARKNMTTHPVQTRRRNSHWMFLMPPTSPTPNTSPTMH